MKPTTQILGVIFVLTLIVMLLALPTMWLWNWLMPEIFGLIEINFWQAWGMNALSGILFKDFTKSNKN